MPKKCPTFITEYLIPSLNSRRFGRHLKWLDKKNSIFQLVWCHKSDNGWSEGKAQVFVGWDQLKGHYQPDEQQYFSKSKQRFRALLYKLCVDGQLKELKSDVKSKKIYCITDARKRRRETQSSSADSGIFSTDDMSSDDNVMISEDASNDEMNESSNVTRMKNLDDHNYSKCSIDTSDLANTIVEHHEHVESIFTSKFIDESKKVLIDQSYAHYHKDLNVFDYKEKNVLTDFPQSVLEDLQIGSKNDALEGNDGFFYDLDHCNGFSENNTPMESTETLNSTNVDMNVQFENFLSDLKMDDFSNLNSFWKKILSWS